MHTKRCLATTLWIVFAMGTVLMPMRVDAQCTQAEHIPEMIQCYDTIDNDCDGKLDCFDSDCFSICGMEIQCADEVDNDVDGKIDCEDSDCFEDPACGVHPTEKNCADAFDNDRDGQTDCADSDCIYDPACGAPPKESNCTNGIDDDNDGKIDCEDSDCFEDPACEAPPKESNCTNGIDDDNDGKIDCEDSDCFEDPACGAPPKESNCTNGIDDDNDGKIDCADSDCTQDPACLGPSTETQCNDGKDDDNDGKTDCADSDCFSDSICIIKPPSLPPPTPVPQCGDGACTESCSTCSLDCGVCPEVCGNGICGEWENYKNCFSDCPTPPDKPVETVKLFCGDNVCQLQNKETEKTCPIDCARSGPQCGDGMCSSAETAENCPSDCYKAPYCGDLSCDSYESCTICEKDCGMCLNQTVNEQEQVKAAVKVLKNATSTDSGFRERVGKEMDLLLAFIDKIDRGDKLSILDKRKIGSLMVTIGKAVANESKNIRLIMSDILRHPDVQRLLSTQPDYQGIKQAVDNRNLRLLGKLLPPPISTPDELAQDVDAIANIFPDLQAEELKNYKKRISLMIEKLYAQDVGTMTKDTKRRIEESAFLMKRMQAMAIDPQAALPSLEDRLQYLVERKKDIADVIGIVEYDLNNSLDDMKDGLHEPSPKNLLRITGIMHFITSTANFQQLEERFNGSVRGMRSGMKQIYSLIDFNISPRVEAAILLEDAGKKEIAIVLRENNIEATKKSISALFHAQENHLQNLLQKVTEEDQLAFLIKRKNAQTELDNATTAAAARKSLDTFEQALINLEASARSHQTIFNRIGYKIQDFFGRNNSHS